MIHHERAGLAKFLMPHVKRGSHRQARVAGGWLHVNLLEPSMVEDFAISDAVESHAAGKTKGLEWAAGPVNG